MATEISLKQVHYRLKHVTLEMHCVIGLSRQTSSSRVCITNGEYVQYINPCFAHGVPGICVKQQHALRGKTKKYI